MTLDLELFFFFFRKSLAIKRMGDVPSRRKHLIFSQKFIYIGGVKIVEYKQSMFISLLLKKNT